MFAFFRMLDRVVGKLVFRTVGIGVAILFFFAAQTLYRDLASFSSETSLFHIVLLTAVTVALGFAVRYCFSKQRTVADALEFIEGDVGDTAISKSPKPKDKQPK